MLFDYFISYLYMRVLKLTLRKKKFLHISLCFSASSVKHPDGHVLASERISYLTTCRLDEYVPRPNTSLFFLCQTHSTLCLFYHIVLCAFSLGFLPRYRYSLQIFSHSQVFSLTFLILLSFGSF
jgi:hypothetical protein